MKLHKKGMMAAGIAAIVMAVALVFCGIGEWVVSSLTKDLTALSAGNRWSASGEPYATIVFYTDVDNAMTRQSIENTAHSISTALEQASITSAENGSVWTYCYYEEALSTVQGPRAASSVNMTIVGGSFFTFHPLRFIYGAPFTYDPALPDGVVLDANAAWKLFGAIDVVGMTMTVGDRECTVTGIVEPERDTAAYQKAYGDSPRMYMSRYGYELSSGEDTNSVTALEVTLPNPVKSFAMGIFSNAVSATGDTSTVVENSERYSILNRFKRMKNLPYTGMRTNRIVYPYFENELQVIDFQTSVWMVAEFAFAVVAAVALLTSLICLYKSGFSPVAVTKFLWQKGSGVWENRKKHAKHRDQKLAGKKRKEVPVETNEGE